MSCFICAKKIKIHETISNKCKCSNVFCRSHKEPESHNCTFDYLKSNQESLKQKNTACIKPKV